MNTKIQDFDYLAEEAKRNFQANIGSLLELHNLFAEKITTAQQKQKDGVFISVNELSIMKDWLMQATTNLMADYTNLDRTNRLTNQLYKVSSSLLLKQTPNLKDLAA